MSRFDFLFDEDAPFDEIVAGYQHLIDTGLAWGRADAVGRTAGNLIEDGYCVLGERFPRCRRPVHAKPTRGGAGSGRKPGVRRRT